MFFPRQNGARGTISAEKNSSGTIYFDQQRRAPAPSLHLRVLSPSAVALVAPSVGSVPVAHPPKTSHSDNLPAENLWPQFTRWEMLSPTHAAQNRMAAVPRCRVCSVLSVSVSSRVCFRVRTRRLEPPTFFFLCVFFPCSGGSCRRP